MAWRQFIMRLDALDPDAVEDLFLRAGAASVTLSDGGNNPVLEPGPGETPLWADTEITGMFAAEKDLEQVKTAVLDEFALDRLPAHRIEHLEDRVWEREWLKDFASMQFGRRLFIEPKGSKRRDDDSAVVYLDPGLAFGTGTHATTALCLEYLDSLQLEGKSMLDYGCGSGVLAIAALRLGCRSATCMDIDPQALIASRQNARDNDVAERLSVVGAADEISGTYDLVVANILAGPLVQYAEGIASRIAERGMLALSGVLCEQADELMHAYAPWILFDEPVFREQDGQKWSRLSGQRRTA